MKAKIQLCKPNRHRSRSQFSCSRGDSGLKGMIFLLMSWLLTASESPLGEELFVAGEVQERGWSNAASAKNGGIACASMSQKTFDSSLAIDGLVEDKKGWAYHGRIQDASIFFSFRAPSKIERIRMVCGHGFDDHHITAFQLWAWNLESLKNGGELECAEGVRESTALQARLMETSGDQTAMQVLSQESRWTSLVAESVDFAKSNIDWDGNMFRTNSSEIILSLVGGVTTSALKLHIKETDTQNLNAVLNELEAWGSDRCGTPQEAVDLLPSSGTKSYEGVSLSIIKPADGSTTGACELVFELDGPDWITQEAAAARIRVMMDSEILADVDLYPRGRPIIIDRDRRLLATGLTRHTLTLTLLDEFLEPTSVSAKANFRLVGPKLVAPGPGFSQTSARNLVYKDPRKHFPQASPTVCATFLSCGRIHLLRQTIGAFVSHMELHEAHVPYEIAWIDQGSGSEAVELQQHVEVEHVMFAQLNYGVTFGINTLLFSMCRRSRYVMTLEEDWLWSKGKTAVPAVDMAVQVMEYDPLVVGVFLRSVVQFGVETSNPGPWTEVGGSGVSYRRMCQKEGLWGAWTNGAAIWHRTRLESQIGKLNEEWGDAAEQEYAQRVGKVFCAAQLLLKTAECENSACNAVFDHIGNERSPVWDPEITYHGGDSFSCSSYGKAVANKHCMAFISTSR